MSRDGAELSDWQWAFNAVNERRKAVIFGSNGPNSQIPVPIYASHITSSQAEALVNATPVESYCDPNSPLVFVNYNTAEHGWDAHYPTGVNRFNQNSPFAIPGGIYRYVHGYGDYPKAGSVLTNSGWFLDLVEDSVSVLTKYAFEISNAKKYSAHYSWDSISSRLYDYVTGETTEDVSFQSFSDFYDYVKDHFHEPESGSLGAKLYFQNGVDYGSYLNEIELVYGNAEIQVGLVPSDVTVYYSSFGDNLGFPVNSTYSNVSYSTRTYSNVPKMTFGFTDSIIPSSVPALDSNHSFSKEESLANCYAVCDFSNYFQY